MMTNVETDVAAIGPLGHKVAMELAATEYARIANLLDSLDPADWSKPTDCAPWDVRTLSTHVLGAMRASGSRREQLRQLREAKRRSGSLADALSALQVEELAKHQPVVIAAEIRARSADAVRGRRNTPALARRFVPVDSVLPATGTAERWRLGYFVDVITTRDCWMHRIDICRATGRFPMLTPGHDGRIVADVVAEWARRHGRPFRVALSGEAGGVFLSGRGAEEQRYDAVEFCRSLSGRGPSLPFDTEVPF